ncbi:MAG: tetratricopeptide repeat protein [Candidatus Eremiobacteraeota bacterium]|nr:tetratricopeptide repeat protein [Candidatus Eremiobacteraeota bacterium]
MRKLLPVMIVMMVMSLWAGPVHANYYWNMHTGRRAYDKGEYKKAIERFKKALAEKPDDPIVLYNLGCAFLKNKNLKEAHTALSKAAELGDKDIRAKAEYNLGDISFLKKKLQESLNHYIRAVDLQQDDVDAKYNIQVIQKLLKKQKEQQKKNQQKKDKDKKGKDKKDKQKDRQKQQQQKQKTKQEMSKEDIKRLLDYFNQKEKKEKARRRIRVKMRPKTEEDW